MRIAFLLVATTLGAAALVPQAGAGGLQWGRNGVHKPTTDLGPVGDGRRTWLKLNCYGCHGNNAAGGMGPNVQHAEKGDVTEAMLQGDDVEGGMRSFKQYATAADASNVAAYLGSIGSKNEPTWLDWWNAVPGRK
ncbi:MAG: cytochrome c [Rhodospirillales bacterium]